MMMYRIPASRYAAGLFALILGACLADQPADDRDPPPPDDTAAAVDPSPWNLRITGGGASLSLPPDQTGAIPFRVACVRDPVIISIESETIAPIGSEERFSFGIDDEPYVFVADVTGTLARGVYAERPIDDEILGRLERARELSAVYGATRFGPYPAPTESDLTAFIAACRATRNP